MGRIEYERKPFPSVNEAIERFFFGGARLASDNKEYLGQVIGECYEWNDKKPTSYKIELADGSVIERKAGDIKIYSP